MKKLLASLLVLMMVILSQTGCAKNNAPSGKTYVLVHGAWQATWVWLNVKAELEKQSNTVITVELPAHGSDQTSPATVSMIVYRDKVINEIAKIKGNVILVGHSMGGVVVTAVAEKIPERIEKLIYIGAFVPANGQSILDLAGQDKQSQLGAGIVPSADQLTLDIKKDAIIPIFCNDGSDAIKKQLLDQFRVEPAIPFADKVNVTSANFGKVNKYYIYTTQDNAIGSDLQKSMVAGAGITQTFSLATSHCPFLSKPIDVANLLMNIAK